MIHTRITLFGLYSLSSLVVMANNVALPHKVGFLSLIMHLMDREFRFALVNLSDEIIWSNDGSTDEPSQSVSIAVNKGFYAVNLGDSSIEGMATLSSDLFDVRNPLRLRIWFDDGVNGHEQLGFDHPLRISAYSLSSEKTSNMSDDTARLISEQDNHIANLQQELDNISEQLSDTLEKVQEIEKNQNQSGKAFDYSSRQNQKWRWRYSHHGGWRSSNLRS